MVIKMLVDIGASIKAKRGDLNFIYAFDESKDNRHTQYDFIYPLNLRTNSVVYYRSIKDIKDIINCLYLLPNWKSLDFLLLHSLEHFLEPIDLVSSIFRIRPNTITIIVPNAQTNLADCKDSGHLFSFTECSLKNLAGYIIRSASEYTYNVDRIMNNQDLYLKIYKI
jgi:hypothetical protein